MEPIGPGSHDRAWNDPPKFAFNASATAGGQSGRRRLMNKRVPIPIGPSDGNAPVSPCLRQTDGPPKDGDLFRMMSPHGPPPTVSPVVSKLPDAKTEKEEKKKDDPLTGENLNPEEMLSEVKTALDGSLERVADELKKSVLDDINKRLEIMKKMWIGGELDPVVQRRMLLLARAMGESSYNEAWAIHQGLIVDFTSVCSAWMVGVKRIISEFRKTEKEAAPEGAETEVKPIDGEEKEAKEAAEDVTEGVSNLSVQSESHT
ncbi:steroid receptor RNA activator 1-like isoform X2 [Penaeus japonicus]|uniref:steroid receptor RNA activator 1-like isoform X2 n=1 Tax=Penaeus japonicus TaxID=27405 RepID=UPI001C71109D|nr:steroid receptor RNA activator 1-like isoform X2 [Penaeus japonicus]